MNGDVGERAALIVALQNVRNEGASIPLGFAAKEVGGLPVRQIVGLLEEAQGIFVNTDVLRLLPEGMGRAAEEVHERLAALVAGTTNEAAQLATLNARAVVDHTTEMQDHGARACVAWMGVCEAIATAIKMARIAQQEAEATGRAAERAAGAQAHYSQSLDGYIQSI